MIRDTYLPTFKSQKLGQLSLAFWNAQEHLQNRRELPQNAQFGWDLHTPLLFVV